GGYLVFGAEALIAGAPDTKGSVTIRVYEDHDGPGKLLAEAKAPFTLVGEGYAWVRVRLAKDERGIRVAPLERLWAGVTSEDGAHYAAFNPFSVSKEARYRAGPKKPLADKFNFKEGPAPVADFILRVNGFGYIEGADRPEPLAGEDDEQVKRMKTADALLDKKEFDRAL